MEVVWLKRDLRLRDHAPIARAAAAAHQAPGISGVQHDDNPNNGPPSLNSSGVPARIVLLYLYEPEMLEVGQCEL